MDLGKTFNVRLEARIKNEYLVSAREKLGMSALYISQQMGLGYSTYINIELLHQYPNKETRTKILDFHNKHGVFMLEEDVFPEELKKVRAIKKLIKQGKIPVDKLIYLSQINKGANELDYYPSPEEEVMKQMRDGSIDNVLKTLTPQEDMVVRMSFGIEPYEEHNRGEIADKLNLSEGRIGQIIQRALWHLRSPHRAKQLKYHLD